MPRFLQKGREVLWKFSPHPTPHCSLKNLSVSLRPWTQKNVVCFPPWANIPVENPHRLSRQVTGLERKWSACQYKTGQDWNRGWGIGLAMQSMSARYVTKLSPGHFAVWFHLQSPAHSTGSQGRLYTASLRQRAAAPSIRLQTSARDARN